MIVCESLGKCFYEDSDKPWAARDLSLVCRPGRIFGLLGPNGSGKTTTLRMISTVLQPSKGEAFVAGHSVLQNPEAVRRNIGFLSGSTGVYDRMTAFEMVRYFGRLYQMEEDRLKDRIDEIFALLDMNDFRNLLCSKMSSGMKQKVSIARTIVHDPPVLVFDEPTVALDILVQRVITDFVRSQKERGKTIIFSTHIMDEAEKLCDDIAIIYKGNMILKGSLAEIKQSHGGKSIEDIFFEMISHEKEAGRAGV